MSTRACLSIVGTCILLALCFDSSTMSYLLALILVYEAPRGARLTTEFQHSRGLCLDLGLAVTLAEQRAAIPGLSAWLVFAGFLLILSYIFGYESGYGVLWLMPWFMGFVIIGGGARGICPLWMGLHRAG